MSGLETAAAIIGITDVAIKGIAGLCDFISDLRDAPERVQTIQQQVSALTQSLKGLKFLNNASKEVKKEVKTIGLSTSVNECGAACDALRQDLERWSKSGADKLSSRVDVLWHRKKIDHYLARIRTTTGTIIVAISVANLSLAAKDDASLSSAQKVAEAISLETRIAEVKKDFTQQLQLATQARRQLEADDPEDDPNFGMALIEVKKEVKVYEQGLANAEVGSLQAKAIKLNQRIGDVYAGENAKVNAGMPQGVVEKIREQIVGDVRGEANATVNVGIFT